LVVERKIIAQSDSNGNCDRAKSRLVYEFVHSHHTQGWRVLESVSVSYGTATPYFPVIDLLRRYCHVADGDEARTVRAKVTGQVLTLDGFPIVMEKF